MKKIVKNVFLLSILMCSQSLFALDSGQQNLAAIAGATDYFKINCAKNDSSSIGDTDHLSFKLIENDNSTSSVTISPQLLNATLTKPKLTSKISGVEAGKSQEISLKGGNGAYTFNIDTFGTNLAIKTAQTYVIQYQCLNSAGKMTTGSSTLVAQNKESTSKTLANDKTVKYVINCAKNKTTGDTNSLKIKFSNKTKITSSTDNSLSFVITKTGEITAQVVKERNALNTIGDEINLQGNDGDYFVMVSSPKSLSKKYSFQYSCLNKKNVETKTSPFQILQDQ